MGLMRRLVCYLLIAAMVLPHFPVEAAPTRSSRLAQSLLGTYVYTLVASRILVAGTKLETLVTVPDFSTPPEGASQESQAQKFLVHQIGDLRASGVEPTVVLVPAESALSTTHLSVSSRNSLEREGIRIVTPSSDAQLAADIPHIVRLNAKLINFEKTLLIKEKQYKRTSIFSAVFKTLVSGSTIAATILLSLPEGHNFIGVVKALGVGVLGGTMTALLSVHTDRVDEYWSRLYRRMPFGGQEQRTWYETILKQTLITAGYCLVVKSAMVFSDAVSGGGMSMIPSATAQAVGSFIMSWLPFSLYFNSQQPDSEEKTVEVFEIKTKIMRSSLMLFALLTTGGMLEKFGLTAPGTLVVGSLSVVGWTLLFKDNYRYVQSALAQSLSAVKSRIQRFFGWSAAPATAEPPSSAGVCEQVLRPPSRAAND